MNPSRELLFALKNYMSLGCYPLAHNEITNKPRSNIRNIPNSRLLAYGCDAHWTDKHRLSPSCTRCWLPSWWKFGNFSVPCATTGPLELKLHNLGRRSSSVARFQHTPGQLSAVFIMMELIRLFLAMRDIIEQSIPYFNLELIMK